MQPMSVLTASPAALESTNSLIALECDDRGRGALTACEARREPVPGTWVAASMPPYGPAIGEDTAPDTLLAALLKTPTILTGPCPPTVAGPYAAWMPRKSLQGCTCSVSRDGGRARALQQTRSAEGAVPSSLAGHAVNPSLGPGWRHPCRHTVPQSARTPHQRVGRSLDKKLVFRHRCRVSAWRDVLAAWSYDGGRVRPCSQAADQPLYSPITPTHAPAPAARRSRPMPACVSPHR